MKAKEVLGGAGSWFWWGTTTALVSTLGLILTGSIAVYTAILILVSGGLILQGLREIPADPPHVVVVTFLGERTNLIKNEGWHFFFLHPWIFNFIPINITKVNLDLPPQKVRTTDRAELEIPVSITWTPDIRSREEVAEKEGTEERDTILPLHTFVNYGKYKGITDVLTDIVQERLREWAFAHNEGPLEWTQAMGAQEEATYVLIRAIVGKEELESMPSNIPTSVLFRYFATPQVLPIIERDKKMWGERLEKVDRWMEKDRKDPNLVAILTKKERNQSQTLDGYRGVLKERVGRRRAELAKARQGNSHFSIPKLGIVLNRLNIGEITPSGAVKTMADQEAKEEQERLAEIKELNHLRKRLEELMKPPPDGPGMTQEQALEVLQTERGKVTKTITESKGSISPETRVTIERIAGAVADTLLKR